MIIESNKTSFDAFLQDGVTTSNNYVRFIPIAHAQNIELSLIPSIFIEINFCIIHYEVIFGYGS